MTQVIPNDSFKSFNLTTNKRLVTTTIFRSEKSRNDTFLYIYIYIYFASIRFKIETNQCAHSHHLSFLKRISLNRNPL